jgi:copper chaperone CopZ
MSDVTAGNCEIPLQITGMSCTMCVKHVTDAIEKVNGVLRTEVTLDPPRAVVRYDPAQTTPGVLIEAVRAAGYDAHA